MTIQPPHAWTMRRVLYGLDVNGESKPCPRP